MLKIKQKKRIEVKDVDGYLHTERDPEEAMSTELSKQKTLLQYNRQQLDRPNAKKTVDIYPGKRKPSFAEYAIDEFYISFRELSCSETCCLKTSKFMLSSGQKIADKKNADSKSRYYATRNIFDANLIKLS